MYMGLGDTTTTTTGFTDGLKLWMTPSVAITAVQGTITNSATAFSSSALPYTAGLLAVPVALLLLLMGGSRR